MVNSTKKYTSKTICRYCGDRRPVCYMTMVPMNAERLSRWIDILGPLFAENVQQHKCNYICRNHLNSPRRSHNRHPVSMQNSFPLVTDREVKVEVKEELEEELSQKNEESDNDCVVMVAPKREVSNQEEVKTERRMNIKQEVQYFHMSNENTQKLGVATFKKPNKKVCRYCGASCEQSEMTRAPTNPDRLAEWIEILGPKFADNVRKFKYPSICRSHLERIRIALPQLYRKKKNNSALVEDEIEEDDEDVIEDIPQKMEDQNDDSFEVLEQESQAIEFETDNSYTITCRVCGFRGGQTMMTPIPTNPKSLQKWASILGSVFFENILQNSAPHFVCMSHLKTIVEELCQED